MMCALGSAGLYVITKGVVSVSVIGLSLVSQCEERQAEALALTHLKANL